MSFTRKLVIPLSLLLAAVLVLSSCSNAGPATPTTVKSAGTATVPPPVDPPEYKFGLIHYGMGTGGEQELWGAEIAVNAINNAGGINGIKLKMVVEDNQSCKTPLAVNAARKLIDVDKVPYILSSCSGPGLATAPIADETKTLVMNIGGGAPQLAGAGKYFFNIIMHNQWKIPAAMAYMKDSMGLSRLAIVAGDEAVGQSSKKIAEDYAPKLGMQVVASETVSKETTDLAPLISRVASRNPQALLADAGTVVGFGVLEKQLVELGYTWQKFSPGLASGTIKVGGKAIDGHIWAEEQLDPANPITKRYMDTYKTAHNLDASYIDTLANDAVVVLAAAIRKAREGGGNYYTGEKLRQAVLDLKTFDNLVVGTSTFLADGTVSRTTAVMKYDFTNNKNVLLRTYTREELLKRLQ